MSTTASANDSVPSSRAFRSPTPSAYLCSGCRHGDNFDQVSQMFFARGVLVQDRAILTPAELCANCGESPLQTEIDACIKADLGRRLLRAAVAKAEGVGVRSKVGPANVAELEATAKTVVGKEPVASLVPSRLLSVGDVAERSAVSKKTVRRWIGAGGLRVVRLGRSVRIREEDLRTFTSTVRPTEGGPDADAIAESILARHGGKG